MNKTLIATAAALGMAAIPNVANAQQREAPDNAPAFYSAAHEDQLREMEPEYRIHFDTLDAERQAMYFGWDAALRDYYWTLTPDQREAWWYLNDQQRITLFQMEGDANRAAAWSAVVAQVDALQADQAAYADSHAGMTFVSNAVVQDIATPAHSGEYPVCTSDHDDHCINAWAAGERGPDVNRPLNYWPGQPASEMQSGG